MNRVPPRSTHTDKLFTYSTLFRSDGLLYMDWIMYPISTISGGGWFGRIIRMRHSLNRRIRSEEHTSELLSLIRISYAVFCLLTKIIAQILRRFQYDYMTYSIMSCTNISHRYAHYRNLPPIEQ